MESAARYATRNGKIDNQVNILDFNINRMMCQYVLLKVNIIKTVAEFK